MRTKTLLVAAVSLVLLVAGSTAQEGSRRSAAMQVEDGERQIADLQRFWLPEYGNDKPQVSEPTAGYVASVLAKARPDECFLGIGENNVYPFDFDTFECQGRPKVNESYVFGMTRASDTLWFGSAPNMGCLVYGTISEQGVPGGLIELETRNSTCEYAAGTYGIENNLPDHLADWRPPSIYTYDIASEEMTQIEIDDPLLNETLGIRSAGSLGNLVFLAGPYITGMGGPDTDGAVYMFAFLADTGAYLGSAKFDEYLNIRKWVVADGVLYTGVMTKKNIYPDPDSAPGGAILRWTGSEADPFSFEVVGLLDGDPVELAVHEGRLFASTWPDFGKLFEEEYDYAGLWMSPIIPPDGLTSGQANGWEKVWSARDYEQDEVAARMYNGGALASFDGYLFWGTTHAPMSAGLAHGQTYGLIDPNSPQNADFAGLMQAIFQLHRPISIFRGRHFGSSSPTMEVVYGLESMPAYVESTVAKELGRVWKQLPNGMGKPIHGKAGFGNFFNTYTWTMSVYEDKLFVGTMDWSHMLMGIIVPAILQDVVSSPPEVPLRGMTFGADLFVFSSSEGPAFRLSNDGIHNGFSYGVRTMVSSEDGLYLGMANASNIATDLDDSQPEGGWELIRIGPAECNFSGVYGDIDRDGNVDWRDLVELAECYTGLCQPGSCDLPLYGDPCCAAADFDSDGGVSLGDMGKFLEIWWSR